MIETAIWSAAVIIFLFIEAMTASLTSIWFAVGAFASLISKFSGAGLWAQVIVFLTVSLLFLILIKKFYNKKSSENKNPTNSDRLIGQRIVVKKEPGSIKGQGTAVINDVEWKVKSENGEEIEDGSTATVLKIEGVRLVVK